MGSWGWALLLKPVIGVVVIAAIFGVPMLLAILLRPLFPAGRLKDFLFRERGGERPGRAADSGQRVLNDATLVGREPRND